MENKRRFLIVILVLLVAIIGTVGLSVALMIQTYKGLNDEFAGSVQAALSEAIQLERHISEAVNMDISQPVHGQGKMASLPILEGIPPADISSISIHKNVKERDFISIDFQKDSLGGTTSSGKFNVQIFRDFLDELFRSRGIHAPYSVLIRQRIPGKKVIFIRETDENQGTSIQVAGDKGDTTLITYGNAGTDADIPPSFDTLYADFFPVQSALECRAEAATFPITECRVRIESPHRMLLGKMGGIIVASVLIALILTGSFIYLLKTILRMKSVGEMRRDFTHNITHELKTPIAAISATNEALADFSVGEHPEKRKKYLDIQRHYLQTLSSMVERILSLSVQESGNFRLHLAACSLRALVAEQVQALPLKYGKDVRIDVEVPDMQVCVDKFHFSNVLQNLLDNAVKYTPSRPHIVIKAGQKGRNTWISISDNGIGIPSSQRKHVFEKFYRVPTGDVQNVRGFGIGLYYCRLVIEKHGGKISISGSPNGGTTVTILF